MDDHRFETVAEPVGTPLRDASSGAIRVQAADGDLYILVRVSDYPLAGNTPGTLSIIVKRKGHIAACDRVCNAFYRALIQTQQTAAADVRIGMGTIDGYRFSIVQPGDLQVLKANGDHGSRIAPMY